MKILTFDVEEWFHILDHDTIKNENSWNNLNYRLDSNIDKVLEVLQRNNQKATFFCLGWLTKNHSHIIKRLDSLGYEVATHSDLHQLVYEQKISEFDLDLERSIKSLEDIIGKKVRAYRAPGFSLKEDNRWVFDILVKYGIEIDCSIFPAKRAHGGFHTFPHMEPVIIESNHGKLKEFPMSMDRILLKNIVYSGGGYFRFFPYKIIRYFMHKSSYSMTYFHPHDFDEHRPVIDDLSPIRKFKATVGLKQALEKMELLIKEFEFLDLEEAVKRVNWDKVNVVSLPERRNIQRLNRQILG